VFSYFVIFFRAMFLKYSDMFTGQFGAIDCMKRFYVDDDVEPHHSLIQSLTRAHFIATLNPLS